MALKYWLRLAVVLVVASLITVIWNQHTQVVKARVTTELLKHERNTALAVLEELSEVVDSVALVVDSLERVRESERTSAAERERVLTVRADSLSREIIEVVPVGFVRDSVEGLLEDLRLSYEARIFDLGKLLTLSDQTIEALKTESSRKDEINVSLRELVRLTEGQRDAWERVANPGLTVRLKRNFKPLTTTLIVGLVVGYAIVGQK